MDKVIGPCVKCLRESALLVGPDYLCQTCTNMTYSPKTPTTEESKVVLTDLIQLQKIFDQVGIKYTTSHFHPVENIPDNECCSILTFTNVKTNKMKTVLHFDKFGKYLRNGFDINE